MPRNAVDDRRHNTCSTGLHFCSWAYLPHYHGAQGRVLVLKIDPANVVSIPSDYANAKGRAQPISSMMKSPRKRPAMLSKAVAWSKPQMPARSPKRIH